MAGMYHLTFAVIYVQSSFNAYVLIESEFCRYMHKCLEVEEKLSNFVKKIPSYLWNNFPRAMEGLESKKKRLNIDDGEGRLMNQSSFTSFALTRNYEMKIHVDVDDADICFILWIYEGMLVGFNFISFHFIIFLHSMIITNV
jgi:hypothetical protein